MTKALDPDTPESAVAAESAFDIRSPDDNGMAQGELDRMDVIRRFENGMYPYEDRIGRSEYEETKASLQVELLKVQRWVKESGKKVVIIFEGRDAAGKGGAIKRFIEHLIPRGARVVALHQQAVLVLVELAQKPLLGERHHGPRPPP